MNENSNNHTAFHQNQSKWFKKEIKVWTDEHACSNYTLK